MENADELKPSSTSAIICFDLDDTLIDDNFKFEVTFCDCIKVILTAFATRPPQIDEVLQLARKLDNEKLATWEPATRYTPQRLLSTWADTYQQLCDKYGVEVKHFAKLQLEGLVLQNFEPPYVIIPGAVETLDTLHDNTNYELHLVTTGVVEIQQRKINVTNLDKFFHQVHIVGDGDKLSYLQKIRNDNPGKKMIMIGNSLRSDVNPALELGIPAIYIPRGSWHQFQADPVNQQFVEAKDIREVVDLLPSMLASNALG